MLSFFYCRSSVNHINRPKDIRRIKSGLLHTLAV
uniref:Uncharacterized protein n=1 Tax=Arundo donax TaxID=35708 RepID=A0A0A9EFJ8_ARUDO